MALATVLSLAAAVIHASVTPAHLAEMPQRGVFMLIATLAQLGGGVLLLTRPRPWVLLATIIGNLLLVATALWAYTSGLPTWLTGAGPEALNWQVVACTLIEAALIAVCFITLLRRKGVLTLLQFF